jgi:hypothetical protein
MGLRMLYDMVVRKSLLGNMIDTLYDHLESCILASLSSFHSKSALETEVDVLHNAFTKAFLAALGIARAAHWPSASFAHVLGA